MLILLKRFTIISGRFVLNKIKFLFWFLLLLSCSSKENYKNVFALGRDHISSEIICPDDKRFMVRYAYAGEIKSAIDRDYYRKIREGSNENYTVIRIPNIESFHISKMPPEELYKCRVEDNYTKKIYPRYIKRFNRF